MTRPEQVKIDEFYFGLVLNDHERALKEVAEFVREYPKNLDLLNTFADDASALMRFDIAEDAEHRLLGTPPFRKSSTESVLALWNEQLARNEFPSAAGTAKQARDDIPDLFQGPYLEVISFLAEGNIDKGEAEISHLREQQLAQASLWLGGLLDTYKGRLAAAQRQWTEYLGIVQDTSETWVASEDVAHLWLARICLLAGDAEAARKHLNQVQKVRDEYLAEAGKYYARLGDTQHAEDILGRLKSHLAGRATNQNRAIIQLVEGEIELKKGNARKSFELISTAAQYPWAYSFIPIKESLANAALSSGHYDIAVSAYQEIVDKRGFAFSWDRPDDWIMAQYGLGHATDLQNRRDLAPQYYKEFEYLWHEGDHNLTPLREARKRISELAH